MHCAAFRAVFAAGHYRGGVLAMTEFDADDDREVGRCRPTGVTDSRIAIERPADTDGPG